MANRVLMPIARFKARDPEALYQGVQQIDWELHLDVEGTLAVDFNSTASAISHTQFGAQRVKDAIVDQFRAKRGIRPSVDREQPDLRINVYVNRDDATVSLDLSGESLHQRGYRREATRAPLKENLAAALLAHAGWREAAAEGAMFFDPMCGSGTIAIEAAWIAMHRAPGLLRERFGFMGWKGHNPKLWEKIRGQATEDASPELAPARVIGCDIEARVIRSAITNAQAAGVEREVHFEKRDFFAADAPDLKGKPGILIFNPPYGERLGEAEELKPFYRRIGDMLKQRYKGWTAFVLAGNLELAKEVGLQASRRYVLFNGPIECRLLRYELY